MNYELSLACLNLAGNSVIITKAYPLDSPGTEIVYVNDFFCKMTGYSPEEVIGKTPRILQGENTSKQTLSKIKAALLRCEPITVELINYTKNRVPFWAELSISPVYSKKNKVEHFISIQKHIGEYKEKEILLQRYNKELSENIASLKQINTALVHDLKEPIRSICGFSQLLEKKLGSSLQDESTIEYFNYIKNSAKRLETTIDTLYQYSMIGNQASTSINSLCDVVKLASNNLHKKITENNASVVVNSDSLIMGNTSELIRLFQNLIDNAVKYAKTDIPPAIEIDITDDGDKAIVLIKDNGIGIPVSFQPEMYNLFSKYIVKKGISSLGAGLAICKKIVTKNNGTIRLLESSSKGTTFELTFSKSVVL